MTYTPVTETRRRFVRQIDLQVDEYISDQYFFTANSSMVHNVLDAQWISLERELENGN